jgi:hypothetical protein
MIRGTEAHASQSALASAGAMVVGVIRAMAGVIHTMDGDTRAGAMEATTHLTGGDTTMDGIMGITTEEAEDITIPHPMHTTPITAGVTLTGTGLPAQVTAHMVHVPSRIRRKLLETAGLTEGPGEPV